VDIGVGAGRFYGGAKDFCPHSPKLTLKILKKYDLLKKRLQFDFWRIFFKSKHIQQHICPNFPQTCTHFPQLAWKKTSAHPFWAPFLKKSKHIKRFCEGFHTFCPHFHRFFPDFKEFLRIFTKSKLWGCACIPCTPASYTASLGHRTESKIWKKASSKQD